MRRSGAVLRVVAALAGPAAALQGVFAILPRPVVAQSTTLTFGQGAAFSSGSRVSAVAVTLNSPLAQGGLVAGAVPHYTRPRPAQATGKRNATRPRTPRS